MAFWSSEKLRAQGAQIIDPYKSSRVRCGSYELSMGAEAFISSSEDGRKLTLSEDECVVIPPGQFALLLTDEEVAIPADVLGLISMRYGVKSRGLVNISGFHVDPGFKGRLKFAVYNAGPNRITITRGESIFMLWIADLDQKSKETYEADPSRFRQITSEDQNRLHGDLASPAQLKERIDRLSHRLRLYTWAAGIVIALMVSVALKILLIDPWGSSKEALEGHSSRLLELERAVVTMQAAAAAEAQAVPNQGNGDNGDEGRVDQSGPK